MVKTHYIPKNVQKALQLVQGWVQQSVKTPFSEPDFPQFTQTRVEGFAWNDDGDLAISLDGDNPQFYSINDLISLGVWCPPGTDRSPEQVPLATQPATPVNQQKRA